ncbi:MAG: hypothetical protein ACR2HH_13205 [Chthoniobacterales bacterium]
MIRAKIFAVLLAGCTAATAALAEEPPLSPRAGDVAPDYVKLVLAMGEHDPDYVDAFYGPAEWKTAADKEKKPLNAIREEAMERFSELTLLPPASTDLERLRSDYLSRQLASLEARVRIVQGEKMKFDDESRALYDAVAPTLSEAHFQKVLTELEQKIPGHGPLFARYEEWRKAFAIPKEKLATVFELAIKACRERTLAYVKLPPNESFTVEYVTNKPWGGYNWYKGNFRSVIQVNTDLPSYIDRALDLAAHEGYPGHHVYNALLEKNLVRDRGWVEFTVYPLFSPQSLIAEGTANFGREVVFTKDERMKFEREVLFPAAGIDPKRVEEYYAVQEMVRALGYAGTEAARRYLNGELDPAGTIAWLEKYALMSPAQAKLRMKFTERYRSYVINYTLGEDMVRAYVEKRGGTAEHPEKRWSVFEDLLSSPRLPSALR